MKKPIFPWWIRWIMMNMRGEWLLSIVSIFGGGFAAAGAFAVECDFIAAVGTLISLGGITLTTWYLLAKREVHREWRKTWGNVMDTWNDAAPDPHDLETMMKQISKCTEKYGLTDRLIRAQDMLCEMSIYLGFIVRPAGTLYASAART